MGMVKKKDPVNHQVRCLADSQSYRHSYYVLFLFLPPEKRAPLVGMVKKEDPGLLIEG